MRFTIALTFLAASAVNVMAAPVPDGGSAYTGAGGTAVGGSKSISDYTGNGLGSGLSALDLGTDQAGNGGKATSGTAVGGTGYNGNGGSAYSGVGGNTNGGNVNDNHYPAPNAKGGLNSGYYGWGATNGLLGGTDVLNVDKGNGGNGGDSSSGNAVGGSSYHN